MSGAPEKQIRVGIYANVINKLKTNFFVTLKNLLSSINIKSYIPTFKKEITNLTNKLQYEKEGWIKDQIAYIIRNDEKVKDTNEHIIEILEYWEPYTYTQLLGDLESYVENIRGKWERGARSKEKKMLGEVIYEQFKDFEVFVNNAYYLSRQLKIVQSKIYKSFFFMAKIFKLGKLSQVTEKELETLTKETEKILYVEEHTDKIKNIKYSIEIPKKELRVIRDITSKLYKRGISYGKSAWEVFLFKFASDILKPNIYIGLESGDVVEDILKKTGSLAERFRRRYVSGKLFSKNVKKRYNDLVLKFIGVIEDMLSSHYFIDKIDNMITLSPSDLLSVVLSFLEEHSVKKYKKRITIRKL